MTPKKGKKKKEVGYKSILMDTQPIPLNRLSNGSEYLITVLTRELSGLVNLEKLRTDLAIGSNAVCKQLKKNTLGAVIVASDIEPPTLIAPTIITAMDFRVPIVKLDTMRELTRKIMGFECIALGLKKEPATLTGTISTIMQKYSSQLPDPKPLPDAPKTKPEPKGFEYRHFNYIFRDSPSTRKFVPEIFLNMQLSDPDYHIEDSTSNVKRAKVTYQPAKVLKVAPNRERKHKLAKKK